MELVIELIPEVCRWEIHVPLTINIDSWLDRFATNL